MALPKEKHFRRQNVESANIVAFLVAFHGLIPFVSLAGLVALAFVCSELVLQLLVAILERSPGQQPKELVFDAI